MRVLQMPYGTISTFSGTAHCSNRRGQKPTKILGATGMVGLITSLAPAVICLPATTSGGYGDGIRQATDLGQRTL